MPCRGLRARVPYLICGSGAIPESDVRGRVAKLLSLLPLELRPLFRTVAKAVLVRREAECNGRACRHRGLQEMAVLYTCIEVNAVVGQVLVEETDEHIAFLCFEATAGMVLDDVALYAYEVAAQG